MAKAYDTLMAIRASFEEFERMMSANAEASAKKHGTELTLSVHADIAHIRKELHDLSLKMFPPKKHDVPPLSDDEWQSYM